MCIHEIRFQLSQESGSERLSELSSVLLRGSQNSGLATEIALSISKDLHLMWKSIRKGYRNLINSANAKLTTKIHDSNDGDPVEVMRQLHFEASGRFTRSRKSWDLHAHEIDQGRAFISLASDLSGTPVGANLITMSDSHALYYSGAYQREVMASKVPVGHALQWAAIEYLGANTNVKSYMLGWKGLEEINDPKTRSIEFFKEGFADSYIAKPYILLYPNQFD